MSRFAIPFLLAALFIPAAAGAVASRNVQVLSHWDEYPTPPAGQPWAYSACWSYIHGDGREYAVLGVASGTAIYNVTDPVHSYPVGFIPGPPSIWREMKSYRSWIYVVTEGTGAGQGLQIVRMTDPEHPVLAAVYATGFVRSHTVQVDTARALLICNGTRDDQGHAAGMRILSLADPEAPVELAHWPDDPQLGDPANYVHDCVFLGTTLYASCVYGQLERVFDLSNPAAPVQLRAFRYPNPYYTHSAWPDSSGQWLYVADEHNRQPLRVFPIGASGDAAPANEITSNPAAIVHNPRVRGHELYLANYTEGVRVLDVRDPERPAEFASLDTYPGTSGGYGGVWEVCPYFPSGTVIASDMETGLWVFQPVRSYGLLEVSASTPGAAAGSFDGIPGAHLYLDQPADSLTTSDPLASERFAPDPGLHLVRARAWGYYDDSALVNVPAGGVAGAFLVLGARPRAPFSGAVRDLLSNAALGDAEVRLRYAPLAFRTGPDGSFRFDEVPADRYRVEVRRAGYVPFVGGRDLGPAATVQDYGLVPAHAWDPVESAAGWSVATGANVQNGWRLGTPVAGVATAPARVAGGAGARLAPFPGGPLTPRPLELQHEEPAPIPAAGVTPLADHSPDPDSLCFVTGQAPDTSQLAENGLAGGISTLVSPEYDLTGLHDPVIGFWRWFSSWSPATGQPDPGDWLAVQISHNGLTWVTVDTTRGVHDGWEEVAIRVRDYLPSGSHVRLRFAAAEGGEPTVARMAVDDVVTYDAGAPVAVGSGPPAGLGISAPWPNPASGAVRLAIQAPRAGALDVRVVDVAGREVRVLHRGEVAAGAVPLTWDGRDQAGRAVRPGLYFVRARLGGAEVSARVVRVR